MKFAQLLKKRNSLQNLLDKQIKNMKIEAKEKYDELQVLIEVIQKYDPKFTEYTIPHLNDHDCSRGGARRVYHRPNIKLCFIDVLYKMDCVNDRNYATVKDIVAFMDKEKYTYSSYTIQNELSKIARNGFEGTRHNGQRYSIEYSTQSQTSCYVRGGDFCLASV